MQIAGKMCLGWKVENPSSGSSYAAVFGSSFAKVAAVTATLLGGRSMHCKFNSDNFTFLKFENPSSSSKVR